MIPTITADKLGALLAQYWYYTCELPDGTFTPGGDHANIVTTRELLSRIDVEGAQALDIGTMEAMVPILLSRRGARVTAIDALDFSRKIELLKSIYNVDFEYHGRVPLGKTKSFLEDKNVLSAFLQPQRPDRGYDLVICSGVLYHVFSPFEVLALCRSLVRTGGLLVVETAASIRDDLSQRWNFDGTRWIYPNGTNTWFPTCRLLDHFLRFLHFQIVDCVYIPQADDVIRVAITARAISELLPLDSEREWFAESTRNFDYEFLCDTTWTKVPASNSFLTSGKAIKHSGIDSVDVHRTVTQSPGVPVSLDRIRLHLSDKV
jgi:tRNA (mo5U34)-methyltransferase